MAHPIEGPPIGSKILKTIWDFSPAEAEALNPPGRRRMNPFSARVARRTRGATDPNGEGQVFPLITDLIQCVRRSGLVATSRRFRIQSEELRNLTRFMAIYGVSSLRYVLRQAKGPRLLEGKSRWERSDFLEGIASVTADGSPPDGIACDWEETAEDQVDFVQGVTDPELRPVKDDRLLQDVALLNKVVNDPAVPAATREGASKWRDFFVRENARIEFLSEVAEVTGIRAEFEALSNSELAKWISEVLEKNGEDGPFSFVYSLGQAFSEFAQAPELLTTTRELLLGVFTAGLVNEFGRRCSEHETNDGRDVSELVVEVYNRDQILLNLGKRAVKVSRCRREATRLSIETSSMAQEFIWVSLSNILPTGVLDENNIPATEPAFLEALMEGAFNKILKQATYNLGTAIKTEGRRRKQMEYDSDAVENYSSITDQTLLPDGYPAERNLEAAVRRKILVEQIKSKADLTEREQKVIELCMSGDTQEEIAKKLSVTQGTVSNRFRSAEEKMRQAMESD